jgi:hypothetical protein
MKILVMILMSLQLLLLGCDKKSVFINYDNKNIQYDNRIDFSDGDYALLTWGGAAAKIHFIGDGVKVLLQNKRSPSYLNVILDDSIFVIQSDSSKKWFTLASNLSPGEHTVQIFKRTNNGNLKFYGFQLSPGAELIKPKKRTKIIEFIGDSVTGGSSIHDSSGYNWRGLNSDNYFTYGAVTARYFDAQYYCVAQGGIGLMVGGQEISMPEKYDRVNLRDADKKWDFSKVQPNIVVINLFQNDYSIFNDPKGDRFKKKFGDTIPDENYIVGEYIKFVNRIKKIYPNTKIICSLGSMDAAKDGSPWPGYIENAVKKINSPNVYYCLFPYKKTSGHPNVKQHKVMADTLINFIKKNKIW